MQWKTAILMMLVGALAAPQAAATSLEPAVSGQALPEGHAISWESAAGDVAAWVVEVWHDGVLEDVVELPADADSYMNEAPEEGIFEYRVSFAAHGTTTNLGETRMQGYPYCMDVIGVSTSWPFVKVHEECLLPPPV